MHARRWAAIGAAAVTVVVSACGAQHQGDPRGSHDDLVRARAVLADYAKAVGAKPDALRLIGDGTIQHGDWSGADAELDKLAFVTGHVVADFAPAAQAPATGRIRWADGATTVARIIPPTTAVNEMTHAVAPCGDCHPLRLTSATLTTAQFETTRGLATVPAWVFTLSGSAVTLARPAVATIPSASAGEDAVDQAANLGGPAVESAEASHDGKVLTVAFTGARNPVDQPCGAAYTAQAVESDTAVAVVVDERDSTVGGPDTACTAVGALRRATVTLAAPLGTRAVLEIRSGNPVPVTR